MTATLIVLTALLVSTTILHALVWRERDRELVELIRDQSRDHVANTERVLAAFVEQTKDSNSHISMSAPHAVSIPNTPDWLDDLPVPIETDFTNPIDLSDPTDWGDFAPTAHQNGAAMDPRDPAPFGIPGLSPEYRNAQG